MAGVLCTVGCTAKNLTLAENGRSDYAIVVSAKAPATEIKAAEEFRRLLELSASVRLPVYTDERPSAETEIVIGTTNRSRTEEELNEDGFLIRTDGRKLFITGGSEKGTLYGVYTFFDKYLGYRCYSPEVFVYPRLSSVRIPGQLHDRQVPVNVYRNTFYAVAEDPFYADWHKLDHMKPDWGMWVHTFSQLLPAETYFEEHPEYFALVDGQRRGMQADGHLHAQLCLSNPEVLRIVTENLAEMIEQNPEAHYWSVSQCDTYPDLGYNCTCPECAALDSAAGSPSGSIIAFVNRVAEHFPGKTISTLAYRYSRKAPASVKPAGNVNIMLCDIECNRHRPIEEDSSGLAFCGDLEQWGKIADNILMWDYVIQFSNLMAPYPNLRTLQPNMRYFVRNGVTAQFQQGNISRGGEFCELRPYLIARLLWNPDADIEAETEDFLKGFYGKAAPYIARYIGLMHDELEKSGLPLTIYGRPYDHAEKGYLRPELFERYEELFDKAEKAAASDPAVLERVRVARLPLTYALFDIARVRGKDETRVFEQADGTWRVRPEALQRLEEFRTLCNKTGVKFLREGSQTPDEYYTELYAFLTGVS